MPATGISTLFFSFLKLGSTAFGGPAMVPYIREMAVTRHKWLDEETFNDGVVLCQSIPGATAMQTAAYVGLRSGGVAGAVAAYVGFSLPAFILMLVLSSLYAVYHTVPFAVSVFNGLQVMVVAIVANATYTFGKSALRHYRDILTALAASALLWAGVSPFLVIAGAALAGIVFSSGAGTEFASVKKSGKSVNYFKQLSVLLLLLFSGLCTLYVMDSKLFSLAALMIKIDLFAFGGGFASIPLMLHEIVNVRGWMDNKTFMDGIALGQITPGPIYITSTFAGYLINGMAGAVVATIAMFSPSLLMVIAVTPAMERLKASAYFLRAASGILASFVGLLLFVTVKFALAVPWDVIRVLLACASFAAIFRKVDVLYIVVVTAIISMFVF